MKEKFLGLLARVQPNKYVDRQTASLGMTDARWAQDVGRP